MEPPTKRKRENDGEREREQEGEIEREKKKRCSVFVGYVRSVAPVYDTYVSVRPFVCSSKEKAIEKVGFFYFYFYFFYFLFMIHMCL